MDKDFRSILLYVAATLAMVGATRGCNEFFNTRSITTPAHHTESYATGLTGHVEFTRYTDGAKDIMIYPGLPRLFDSELLQDLEGDGIVDRIRQNGADWNFHQLTRLLARTPDYAVHKKQFDEADQKLVELERRFSQ